MAASISINLRFVDGRPVTTRSTCRIKRDGDADFQDLTLQGSAFVGTVPTPADRNGAATYVVAISGQEFWAREERFSLTLVSGRPLLLAAGRVWPRSDVNGTFNGGLSLSLDLVALRLQKVTDVTPAIADSFEVFDFDADILGPFAQTGQAQPAFLDPKTKSLDNRRLSFFKWFTGHATIGVYVPTSALPVDGKYIFYFKPPKHAGFSVQSVAEVYLTGAGLDDHQLLADCELAQSEAVFCFLFGESGNPEIIANAAVLSDVLWEIDLLVRSDQIAIGSGVLSVALAAFSEGGRLLNNVLTGLPGSRLRSVLDGIFVFDCWFGEGKLEEFRARIREWYGAGSGRVLRVYQGVTVTDPDILAGQRTPHVGGPDGTVQKVIGDAGTPDYFYLKMTEAFLRRRALRLMQKNDLHHAVPKLFLVHAIKTTSF